MRASGVMAMAVATILGCGGKAVVDGGGAAGGSSDSGGGEGNRSPVCFTPDPVGEVLDCGGTSGSGSPPSCETSICDQDGNRWVSRCSGQGCECRFNGNLRCTCSLDGPGAFCSGNTPSCCPDPFPD